MPEYVSAYNKTQMETAFGGVIDIQNAAAAISAEFPDWTSLDTATNIKVGRAYRLTSGALGSPETVKIVAAGTYASPDGVLVRNLTASGLQGVSTRQEYASYAEFDADPRGLTSGQYTIPSIGASGTYVTTGQNLTTAAGTKVIVNKDSEGRYNILHFGAPTDGVTVCDTVVQTASQSGNVTVVFPRGYTFVMSGGVVTPSDNTTYICEGVVSLKQGNPFFFNVNNKSNVTFDGFVVAGNNSTWVYAWNSSGTNNLDSRSAFCFVYAQTPTNLKVKNCRFDSMYSAAVFVSGAIVSTQAQTSGVTIEGCEYTNGYFELSKVEIMDDVNIIKNKAYNNRNSSGISALVANDFIVTACSNIIVEDNFFGACDGDGFKSESLNGPLIITNNVFDLNDFNNINLQESASERPDVLIHQERAVISNNILRRAQNYAVSGDSSTANAVQNVDVLDNTIDSPVGGGVVCSGSNWNINNHHIGKSVTRASAAVNPYGVFVDQANGNAISNVRISGTFDCYNSGAVQSKAWVQIGYSATPAFTIDKLTIENVVYSDFDYRAIWFQNETNASNVTIKGTRGNKTTLNGTSSFDIYAYNSANALKWQVYDNIVAQSCIVNLVNSGSLTAMWDNKSLASEYPDTTNLYYVNANGTLASNYDFGNRNIQFGSSAPTTGSYRRGDLVWNLSAAASGNIGWVCVTAGSPGTWKTFGTISA